MKQLPPFFKHLHFWISTFLIVVFSFGVNYFGNFARAAAPWPGNSQWNIITGNGSPLIDRENSGSCTDPTNGGASPSQENDIGSQSKCGSAPRYNPGFVDQQFSSGTQPNATAASTFSAANYYKDAGNNSNACSNLSDDTFFFRTRIASNPLQTNANNGFKNSYWWATLDVNGDGLVDFYVRVNGNGNKSSENITVIHEESSGPGDPLNNDPTGEPVIATYTNPINLGIARAVATQDNGTVGDSTEYFIDWQIPATDFKSSTGTQVLCYGNHLVLTNYSTSDANQPLAPFQKDFIQAAGTVSDVVALANPDYSVTKTAADVNGGTLFPGDEVEYTVTATNIGSNLSGFQIVDPIPAGAAYVANSMKVTLGDTTYNLTDASGTEPTCPASTHCTADFDVSNGGAVTFANDWLYAAGSANPLYSTITFKFKITFAAAGTYSNQATAKNRELADKLSDDPAVGGTADPTNVTVDPPPPPGVLDLAVTKSDGVVSVLPGSDVTYTMTVTNNGPNDAVGATFTDTFDPTVTGDNWTCTASAGSGCTASGSGNISDSAVNLLAGGTATYTVTANTDVSAGGVLANTARVAPPAGFTDTDGSNDSATDTDSYTPMDFGDAPDPVYPTLFVSNGARHTIVTGEYLGSGVDQEANGQPSATAGGDDANGSDDEDGIVFTTPLITGNNAAVSVTAAVAGKLDGWIDYNANGTWGDPGEQVFTSQTLSAGVNNLSIPVPAGATAGDTFARFRFSLAGGLSYTGAAPDGEVEDYKLTILTQPDLSTSTKTDDDTDDSISNFQTITYVITVNNTGGSTGTGINVDDVLDANLENLSVSGFSNCGLPTNSSVANPPAIHVSNVTVLPGNSCTVTFTAQVKAGATAGTAVGNTATIAAATEGGSGATPSSDTLTIATLPNITTSTHTDDDGDNNVSNSQTVTYTLTISNTGNGTGTGINVDDILDANLENLVVNSITNCGSPSDNSTTSPLANELHVSGISVTTATPCVISYSASVTAAAAGSSVIPNTASISAPAEGGSGVLKSADNLVVDGNIDFSGSTKTHGDPDNTVAPGDAVTYTISIVNSGNTPATGITASDTVDANFGTPANFNYSNCGSPNDDFTAPPLLEIRNIAVGGFSTCTISYDLTVDNPITGAAPETISLTNSATIAPANGSGTLTAGTLNLDVTPDLSTSTVSDSDVDNNIVPGQSVTYTVTINNTGNATATGVSLNDVMDTHFGNLNLVSISSCGSSSATTGTTAEPPVLNVSGLKIDPGVACVIQFTVDADAGLPEGTAFGNSATISAAAEGGSGATPSSDTLTVSSVPFLTVSKTTNDADNVVTPGQIVTYTVTIGNDGNGNATGIGATDIIDSHFSVPSNFSFSNCGGLASATFTDPVMTFRNISVAVPVDCVISYVVTVNPAASDGTTMTNNVDVSSAAEGGNDPAALSATTLAVTVPPTPPVPPPPPAAAASVPAPVEVKVGGSGASPSQFARASINPELLAQQQEKQQSCLAYDPDRNLSFVDLKSGSNRKFQKAAEILRDTYIVDSHDYVLSGYQSFTKDVGQRNIGLNENITKLEWLKILMLSHCLPIRNALSLKNKTIKGNPLPHFTDLPLQHNGDQNHDWYVDTIYSAAYYEIIGSNAEQKADPQKYITVAEGLKMAVKTGESLKILPQERADKKVHPLVDRAQWYFEYYSKAAAEGIFSDLIQLPDKADTPLKRDQAFYDLLATMLTRDLFSVEDKADIKQYFQEIFISGQPTHAAAESVLGVSNVDRLLEKLESERQRAAGNLFIGLVLAGLAFVVGRYSKNN